MQLSNMSTNSSIIGETITTNNKFGASYFNNFLQMLLLNQMKRLLKLKSYFWTTNETIFLSPKTPADI